MKKHVVIAGKFRLVHNAHKELIIRASSLTDIEHLHILICDNINYKRHSKAQEVRSAMMEILKGLDVNYSINIVPETNNDIQNPAWDELVIKTVSKNMGYDVNPKNIIAVNSKENYDNYLFSNTYIQCDLGEDVSATSIEENPYDIKNAQHVAKEFMPYINKKVVISGVESSGKTVLSNKLAKLFNTTISEECGRYYAAKVLQNNDDAFEPKDFVFIATNQMLQDKQQNLKAHRLLLVDTDPIVTLRFLRSYKEHYIQQGLDIAHWKEDYDKAESFLINLCESYKSDLTLLLKPNCDYVQDGTRWTQEQETREKHFNELMELYDSFNIKYTIVENENWLDKLDFMKTQINKLMHIK